MKDAKEIIALWPSINAMAEDLQQNPQTVRKWKDRNSIPPSAWVDILDTKIARRNNLTAAKLLAAARRA